MKLFSHWPRDSKDFWQIIVFLPMLLAAAMYFMIGMEFEVLEAMFLPLNCYALPYVFVAGRFYIRTEFESKEMKRELRSFPGVLAVSVLAISLIMDSTRMLLHDRPIDESGAIFAALGAALSCYVYLIVFMLIKLVIFHRSGLIIAFICLIITFALTVLSLQLSLQPSLQEKGIELLETNKELFPLALFICGLAMTMTYSLYLGLIVSFGRGLRSKN